MKNKISLNKLAEAANLEGFVEAHLSKEDMKRLYGGNLVTPLASATQTKSGNTCDGTAVCNCRPCPTGVVQTAT